MSLGERVKKAREARDLTQAQLARAAKLPTDSGQANISALEKRKSKTSEYLFAIADALRVNPRWLQDGEPHASGLDSDAWREDPQLPADETDLLRDYRQAGSAWKLTTRLVARTPPEEQAELSTNMNILMTTIFGKATPNERLGDKWTRPDAKLPAKK
jgi:transcriptional regulator with XRE-family HTH domain